MMPILFVASVLALVVLAVRLVAVLALRLFTKRRPPLCTRRIALVAAAAVGIVALGLAGIAADDRRFDSLLEGLHGLEGEDVRAVETRFGPGRRYPDSHTPVSVVLPHRTTNEIVEVRTYRTTPWYSCYPSFRTVYAGFDESGSLRLVDFDD